MTDIALALLASAFAQLLSARSIELHSEIICWIVLPLAAHFIKLRRENTGIKFTSLVKPKSGFRDAIQTKSLLFALGVAVACSYRAQERVVALYVSLDFHVSNVDDLNPTLVFRLADNVTSHCLRLPLCFADS